MGWRVCGCGYGGLVVEGFWGFGKGGKWGGGSWVRDVGWLVVGLKLSLKVLKGITL